MQVAIAGPGAMGMALGALWGAAGHSVTYCFTRDLGALRARLHDRLPRAHAATVEEAVLGSEAVLIACHLAHLDRFLEQSPSLRGRLLVDCTLPVGVPNADLALTTEWSAAENLQLKTEAYVVKAFNTASACFIALDRSHPVNRTPMFFAGDDIAAKCQTAILIEDANFEPVEVGDLRAARYLEPFGLLMAQLAAGEIGPDAGYSLVRPR